MDKSNSFWAQNIDPILNQKTPTSTDADTTRAQKRAKSNTNIKQNENVPINNCT